MQTLLLSTKKILLAALFSLVLSLFFGAFTVPENVVEAQTRACSSSGRIECSNNQSVGDGCTLAGNRSGSCQPLPGEENLSRPNCYCLPNTNSPTTNPNSGSSNSGGNTDLDIDESFGLETIRIPFFPQVSLPSSEYATFLSWASFVGGLFSIGLVVFWVALILRAAFEMLKSEGNEEMVADSITKLKSVFIGAALAILFPIGLSVIGGILGLGNLWSWPAALRDCPGSSDSNYYYQEVLKLADQGVQDTKAQAEANCF